MNEGLIDRRTGIFLALLFAALVLVPLGNLAVAPGDTGHVPSYIVALLGKYLTYALLAVALGALIVAAAKSWLTAAFPDAWLYALGLMFILVTIFLPRGVHGLLEGIAPGGRAAPAAQPEPAE